MPTANQIADSVTVTVDGQPVTYCPLGMAYGWNDLATRGRGLDWANVDRWPSTRAHRLTTGAMDAFCILNTRGMFQQEIYVYLLELGCAVSAAIDLLKNPEVVERECPSCKAVFVRTTPNHKFCKLSCRNKYSAWRKLQALAV